MKKTVKKALGVKSKLMKISLKVGHSSNAYYFSAQLWCLQALRLPEGKCTLATSSFCPAWSDFKQAHQLQLELHLLPADGEAGDNHAALLTLEGRMALRVLVRKRPRPRFALTSQWPHTLTPPLLLLWWFAADRMRHHMSQISSHVNQLGSSPVIPRPSKATRALPTGNAEPIIQPFLGLWSLPLQIAMTPAHPPTPPPETDKQDRRAPALVHE